MYKHLGLFISIIFFISVPLLSLHAGQTAPAASVGKGSIWIIGAIDPPQKTAARGQEAFFDIELKNLSRCPHQRVEVSVTPAVSGHSGWFAIKPFRLDTVRPQQGFRARVSITPTSGAPVGKHTFFTSIKAERSPLYIIRQGPELHVEQTGKRHPCSR